MSTYQRGGPTYLTISSKAETQLIFEEVAQFRASVAAANESLSNWNLKKLISKIELDGNSMYATMIDLQTVVFVGCLTYELSGPLAKVALAFEHQGRWFPLEENVTVMAACELAAQEFNGRNVNGKRTRSDAVDQLVQRKTEELEVLKAEMFEHKDRLDAYSLLKTSSAGPTEFAYSYRNFSTVNLILAFEYLCEEEFYNKYTTTQAEINLNPDAGQIVSRNLLLLKIEERFHPHGESRLWRALEVQFLHVPSQIRFYVWLTYETVERMRLIPDYEAMLKEDTIDAVKKSNYSLSMDMLRNRSDGPKQNIHMKDWVPKNYTWPEPHACDLHELAKGPPRITVLCDQSVRA